MAEWGDWQILSPQNTKLTKTTILSLWKLTKGTQHSKNHLCLKTAERQVRTLEICGILAWGSSYPPALLNEQGSSATVEPWGQSQAYQRMYTKSFSRKRQRGTQKISEKIMAENPQIWRKTFIYTSKKLNKPQGGETQRHSHPEIQLKVKQ